MKNNTVLKQLAAISKQVAIKSAGAASVVGCHQPKVPAAVRQLKQAKQK